MKKISYVALISIMFFAINVNAQIKGNQVLGNSAINLSSAFLDASSSTLWNGASPGATNVGKGLIFPSVNLSTLVLTHSGAYLASNNPNRFNGMVVYNTVASATTASGITTAVVPGFYYFSNPTKGTPSASVGRWLPLGGEAATVKSKTVSVTVPANPTTATLALGTSTITANEVTSFLGAKIYDSSNNLVMTANSAYDKATNLLTTGNGMMYQVLGAGTYQVVVDYK